jgi:predicted DNA-binding protein
MQESSGTFDQFMVKTLSEEIKELHNDRAAQADTIAKLEQFVVGQLSEEIQEFQADRQDVVETKVRLVKEAREQFKALKENFVKKSSAVLEEAVTAHLKSEIGQLKEDIEVAKNNNFGRKIFEAFATEFSSSMLNENQEIKDLKSKMEEVQTQLDEAKVAVAEKNQIVESKEAEIKAITESTARKDAMESLLKPLNKEKGAIMRDLLESVQTTKLKGAFDRYLPAVLDGKSIIKESKVEKEMINENIKEVTGDKQTKKPAAESKDDGNIVQLRALAGLK